MSARTGFIGLGDMGEPMCRNLAQNSGATVIVYDRELYFPVVGSLNGSEH